MKTTHLQYSRTVHERVGCRQGLGCHHTAKQDTRTKTPSAYYVESMKIYNTSTILPRMPQRKNTTEYEYMILGTGAPLPRHSLRRSWSCRSVIIVSVSINMAGSARLARLSVTARHLCTGQPHRGESGTRDSHPPRGRQAGAGGLGAPPACVVAAIVTAELFMLCACYGCSSVAVGVR